MDEACAATYPGSSSAYVSQLINDLIVDLPDHNDAGFSVVQKCSAPECRGTLWRESLPNIFVTPKNNYTCLYIVVYRCSC